MKKLFFIALLTIVPLLPLETVKAEESVTIADAPTWIMAPSISLFAPMQGVGINEKGEMDVPSGDSNNVGWYEHGVLPGNHGTAVLDAHVFAAFQNLSQVKPGEYIYIFMQSGKILSFMVKEKALYSLSALSPHTLFEPYNATKKINLITCAGAFLGSTYSHRLIVSAELV
jgi:sortase A